MEEIHHKTIDHKSNALISEVIDNLKAFNLELKEVKVAATHIFRNFVPAALLCLGHGDF